MNIHIAFIPSRCRLFALAAWGFLNMSAPSEAQTPHAVTSLPANVFTEDVPRKFDGLVKGAVWSVLDWEQRVVAQGTLASGTTLTPPVLPIGYYTLSVKESGKTFSVPFGIVLNPASRTADPQSPYALDSAQAWQSGSVAGQDLNAAAELARLAGVPQVRDRTSWKDTNATRGTYNWGRYSSSVQSLSTRGIGVLEVFSGAPAWTRTNTQDLPSDLLALYDFGKAAGKQFASSVSAWEFWNEPDLDSCRDPAWDFATAQKAAYLGFKAGAPTAKVLLGSNAVSPTPRFFELALENGVGAGFDIFNAHLYGSENVFPGHILEKENLLARFGLANTPIWVTEVGSLKEETGGAAPLVANNREHTEAQERAQAEHVVKALVTLDAENVQRSFYFMLLPYNERDGEKPWGLLRWNWTVKPGFCALANLTAVLAGHDYVGTLDVAGVDAYVFEKRGQPAATRKQTVVFWAASQAVTVTANWARNAKLTDLVGTPRTLTLNSANQPVLQAGTSPQFLTGVTPVAAFPAGPTAPAARVLQPVVLGFTLNDPSITVNRTALNLPTGAVAASLKIWNFSDRTRVATLTNASAGVTIGSLPTKVTLQPRAVQIVPLSVQRTTAAVAEPMIKIVGTSENVPVGPLVVPARPSAGAFNQKKVAISNINFWRKNAAGTLTLAGDSTANSMRFTVQFAAGTSWWVFPALKLSSAGVRLAGSAGVSFEVKAEGTSVDLQRSYAILKTTNAAGQSKSFQMPIWIGTSWETATLLWDFDAPDDFIEADAIELQIGANSNQAKLTYTVRNLQVLTVK